MVLSLNVSRRGVLKFEGTSRQEEVACCRERRREWKTIEVEGIWDGVMSWYAGGCQMPRAKVIFN